MNLHLNNCSVIDLGCFGHCDDILLPIEAHKTDLYTVEFDRKGNKGVFDIVGVQGENLIIPKGSLNESGQIKIRIRHKDDMINGIEPQLYTLKINIKINHNVMYTY